MAASDDSDPSAGPASSPGRGPAALRRTPVIAWVRPLLVLLGGLAAAVVLAGVDQLILAVPLALLTVLMTYWTSPLRSGPHTPLSEALGRRSDTVAIILWAPGNPLSARMQTAIRGQRPDVLWVNVYQDPDGRQLLAEHGGVESLPLVIVGPDVKAAATAGDLLDMQEAGRGRAAGR